MMERQNLKVKAMLSARLIADVSSASTIHNNLLRSAIKAAEEMERWMLKNDNVEETVNAGMRAIRHLRRIKWKSLSVSSEVLNEELVEELIFVTYSMKMTLHRYKRQYQNLMSEQIPQLNEKGLKNSGTPAVGVRGDMPDHVVDWNFWSSDDNADGDEEEEKEEDVDLQESQRRAKLELKKREEKKKKAAMQQLLAKDIGAASKKGRIWFAFLFIILCLILIIGFIAIVAYHSEASHASHDEMARNITQDQAQLVRQGLSHLSKALSAAGIAGDEGRALATKLLQSMTTRKNAMQDKVDDMHSYITEFRGAVQDFSNQNAVTAVTTPRSLGALCRENKTFSISPENDAFSGKQVVMSVLTPNECRNDASYDGIFEDVIPSYMQYEKNIETYRRTEARLACFYDSSMDLSVAVTHEHKPFAESMVPDNTELDGMTESTAFSARTMTKIIEFGLAGLVLSMLLVWAMLQWAMASPLAVHKPLFPLLVGLLIAIELLVGYLCVQYEYGKLSIEELQTETKGLVQALGSLLLSDSMGKYNLTGELFDSLATGLFDGRLLATNLVTHDVKPVEMQNIAVEIDAVTIARYRRGLYNGVAGDYVVASTFVYSTDWNYVLMSKLPQMYKANASLGVIFSCWLLSSFVVHIFLNCNTPLRRLRKHTIGSHFLYYWVPPSLVRFVYYVAVLLLSVVGIVIVSCFEISLADRTLADQAATTMGLLGPMLRSGIFKDECTNGCGMPSFTLTLYYRKVLKDGETYVSGDLINGGDLPFPYPSNQQDLDMYAGLQLILSDVHTTLLNIPSFATPLVNSTSNISYPPHIVRNMLITTSINDTVGYVIERFPSSYNNTTLSFCLISFGICLLLSIAVVVITASERVYSSLHDRVRREDKEKAKASFKKQYVILGLLALLPVAGFGGFFFVSQYLIRTELVKFSHRELSFMAYAIGYRVGLVLLDSDLSPSDLIDYVVEAVHNVSISARQMGSVFCRVRLLQEYPERGSGTVKVFHVENSKEVNLGSVDSAYIPVCGEVEADVLSSFGVGMLQYCYVEVPQKVNGTVENIPRLFLLVTTNVETMLNEPMKSLMVMNIKMLVMIGGIVGVGIGIALFVSMHTAHRLGYPLTEDEEKEGKHTVEKSRNKDEVGTPLAEPIPEHILRPFFLGYTHRVLWFVSIVFLGAVVLYYCTSVSYFLSEMETYNRLDIPEETQYELAQTLLDKVAEDAYNYVVFPFSTNTIDRLIVLRTMILDGTCEYKFLTEDGKTQFTDALLTSYKTISSIDSVLSSSLGAANQGFASYCSSIASSYESNYITRQTSLLQYLSDIRTTLEAAANSASATEYENMINFAFQLTELYDLATKLFILDHMAVTSYAYFGYSSMEDWPFGNPDTIISITLAAAADLTSQIKSAITTLTTLSSEMISISSGSISSMFSQVSDLLSSSVAVNARTATIWNTQMLRCEETLGAQNQTEESTATEQEQAQIMAIQELNSNLSSAMVPDIYFRKSVQLVDYLESGKPFALMQPSVAWERWARLIEINAMMYWAFYCTLTIFVLVVLCLVVQWSWMQRARRPLVWESKQRYGLSPERRDSGAGISGGMNRMEEDRGMGKSEEVGGFPFSRVGGQVGRDNVPTGGGNRYENNLVDVGGGKLQREGKTLREGSYPGSSPVGKEVDPLSLPLSSPEKSIPGSSFLPSLSTFSLKHSRFAFGTKRCMLCIAVLLSFSLIPVCCCHWIMSQAYQTSLSYLPESSLILAMHPKMDALFTTMSGVLLQSVLYYVGNVTTAEMQVYLETLRATVIQVGMEFQWDVKGEKGAVLDNYLDSFEELYKACMNELSFYVSTVSTLDVKDFFTPQSAFSRATLNSLTSANTYGTLSPQSCTTSGSALATFFSDLYTTTLPKVSTASGVENFLLVFNSFEDVCKGVEKVAKGQLTLWHAIVAGAIEEGASIAVQYGGFESLVGASGLASISSSSNPSGTDAANAVQAYFQDLLTNYGTSAQQTALFTDTTAAPSDAGESELGAYKAAGFVASYLTSTTTEAKFSNIFGYNRNLTASSVTLQGQPTIVELLNTFNSAEVAIYAAIVTSGITTDPAFLNTYIWYTQLVIDRSDADYKQLTTLQQVLFWCSITSFWALIVATFAGIYILSILE